jgi:hypothetical protein
MNAVKKVYLPTFKTPCLSHIALGALRINELMIQAD